MLPSLVHDHGSTRVQRDLAEPDDLHVVLREPDASFDRVGEADLPARAIDYADVDDLCVEDLLDPIADQVVHRLHLEVLREAALHVVDEGELGVPLPGLLEQPGVLERDAQAAGDRGEETHVAVAERVVPVDVLEGDRPRRLAADDQGHEESGLRRLPLEDERIAVSTCQLGPGLLKQQRLPRLDHVLAESDHLDRLIREADALLDPVREMDQTVTRVEDPDVDDLCVEDLLEPITDQVVHRLHLEVLGQSALNVVDQCELGVPLTSLLEQPRVLEGDAQAAGERRQQTHVRVAEGVLAIDVLERDDAGCAFADDERHEDA